MKLTTLLIVIACVHIHAKTIAQRITLKRDGVTLGSVFKEIEKQSGLVFFYDNRILKGFSPVDVDYKNTELSLLLRDLLQDLPLKYNMVGKHVVITKDAAPKKVAPTILPAIQRSVHGTVRDEQGIPLGGVTVIVNGTERKLQTDNDGNFSIAADVGQVLQFSSVGYQIKEVITSDQSVYNVTLQSAQTEIDEVVVVGYGTQKKINLTGAVSTVNLDEALSNRPITNASQALSGTVSGLWVSQNSGSPGNDGAQIRIRGWGTLNNANPLVLIDGVEGSLGDVNPNDIESITVLKDAASSAIYGSRAANGVVLVSLKSGKYSEGMAINWNSYAGVQSLGRKYDLIDNSAEYMRMWNEAFTNQGGSEQFSPELIEKFEDSSDPYRYPNVNFFDEVFRNSMIHEHNLSLNGGSDKSRYYMSFNYLGHEGMIMNTNSNRYGVTLNLESKVNNWLSVGGRFNGTRKTSVEPFDFGRVMYIFSNGAYPFTAPYTGDGQFGAVQALDENGDVLVDQRNPLIEAANGQSENQTGYYKMNAFLNVRLSKSLTWNTNLNSQYSNSVIDKHNQLIYGYTDQGKQVSNLNYSEILEASRLNSVSSYNTLFSTLNFDERFNDTHNISAIAGMQVEGTTIKDTYARRSDPPIEGLTQVDAGTNGIVANGNKYAVRLWSYFGRVNYAFLDKYLFEMNIRADASSRFKEGNRWGYFPAFSAGWRLGEEPFIKNINLFSDMKLRVSWGKLGNQNINDYWPYLATINRADKLSYNFGGSFVPGVGVTALVDENLSWETTTSLDVGLDFSMLNNKLVVEADYFRKNTSDIIVQLPVPQVLGEISAPFENIGEMVNNGVEFNISYEKRAKERKEFGYRLGTNLTYVQNEVTRFLGVNSPDQLYLIREGFSYQELYGFKAIGIYRSDAEAAEHMHANGYTPSAGEVKYEDLNSDGRLDYQDSQVMGNTIPKFTFGASASFTYGGFDLSILLQGIAGVHAYTNNAWTRPFGTSGGTITKRWRDAWTPENPNASIPSLKLYNTWDHQNSSFWVSDLSYVKLKNIQLGYSFKGAFLDRIGVKKLYTYVNGQNLFAWVDRNYEGFDPERNTFDTGDNYYPVPRIFTFGVNVNL